MLSVAAVSECMFLLVTGCLKKLKLFLPGSRKITSFYCSESSDVHCFFALSRAALERERKTKVSNLEQAKVMEKNMFSLAREIEKLHAELANAERRSRVAAANLSMHVVSVGLFSYVISIVCTQCSILEF